MTCKGSFQQGKDPRLDAGAGSDGGPGIFAGLVSAAKVGGGALRCPDPDGSSLERAAERAACSRGWVSKH